MTVFTILIIFHVFGLIDAQFPCDQNSRFGATTTLTYAAVDHADDDLTSSTILNTQEDSGFVGKGKCCGIVEQWTAQFWSTDPITFQMWRLVPNTADEYKLIGEKIFTPTTTDHTEVDVLPDTNIYIQRDDYMGWKGNSLWKKDAMLDTRLSLSIYREDTITATIGRTYTISAMHNQMTRGYRGYSVKMTATSRPPPSCNITLLTDTVTDLTPNGTVLGSTVGTTPDPYAEVTLDMSVKNFMDFDQATGRIVTVSNLTVTNPPNRFITIKIVASDDCINAGTCSATLTVQFTNHPVEITSLPDSTSLIESTIVETRLHTITTDDMNRNTITDDATCSINSTSPPNGPFRVDRGAGGTFTLILLANPDLDYDVASFHDVHIRCDDQYGSFDVETFTLFLTPNQAPYVNGTTATGGIFVTVDAKTTGPGTIILRFNISDVEGDAIVTSFVKVDPNSPFIMNSNNEVYATEILKFQEIGEHHFNLMIGDRYNDPVATPVTIHLTGINIRPQFDNCPESLDISETKYPTFRLFQPIVTDANFIIDNQQHTFTMRCEPKALESSFIFDTIDGSVELGARLDYEDIYRRFGEDRITLTISVTDGVHPARNDCVVDINVIDMNEQPTLSIADASLSFYESIGQIELPHLNYTIHDEDVFDNHTFAIVGGNDEGYFDINTTSGQISLIKPCDREGGCPTDFDLSISLSDLGGLEDITAIKVYLLDVNDNAPKFDDEPHEIIATPNTAIGDILLNITATDPDEGLNADMTYSIAGIGLGARYFDLSQDGSLSLRSQINYTGNIQFTMTVCASDMGTPSLRGCTGVRVFITTWSPTSMSTTPKPQPCLLCTEHGVALITVASALASLLAAFIVYALWTQLRQYHLGLNCKHSIEWDTFFKKKLVTSANFRKPPPPREKQKKHRPESRFIWKNDKETPVTPFHVDTHDIPPPRERTPPAPLPKFQFWADEKKDDL